MSQPVPRFSPWANIVAILENDMKKMYVHFVDPLNSTSRRQAGDDSMCVWEHDLSLTTMLFRPLGI
jgi:hypothetical protein